MKIYTENGCFSKNSNHILCLKNSNNILFLDRVTNYNKQIILFLGFKKTCLKDLYEGM